VEVEKLEAVEAKKRQGSREDLVVKIPQSSRGRSRDIAGKKVGVSGTYVTKAKAEEINILPLAFSMIPELHLGVARAAREVL
jgi:hypothetical protein